MLVIAVGLVAALVTMSTLFYFGVMSILLWKLGFEGAATRRTLSQPLLPTFFQNFGIPLAILGFAFQRTDLVVVAGLLIALGILSTSKKSISLHPAVETPMLILAILSLVSVGLFHVLF
ncbi:MAG: hypothetical protein ACE5KF_10770 [Kiloniellaceae bacterium]